MNYPKSATIVDVGPRDGLQNESRVIALADKVRLIEDLAAAGLTRIEAGSFVSPKWVPQMADSESIFAEISRKEGVSYAALTPNMKGLERALKAKVSEIAVFAACSEAFSQKNLNCSISESLQRFREVATAAVAAGIPVRGYASCVLGCPYEGDITADAVAKVTAELLAMGCYEVSLGDTIGTGTPGSMHALLERLLGEFKAEQLAVHCHDTYGQALANILIALQLGVTTIDASVAGLGGCPYAKGATGNVATEDVVYMLDGLGITSGLNLDGLIAAGNRISASLNRDNGSRVARALSNSNAPHA